MFKNLTKAEKSWVLYDVGNSAFTMLACSLIPIWFKALAIGDAPGQITGDQATAYYSIAIAVVTVVVALLGPVLGAIADHKDTKKNLLYHCCCTGGGRLHPERFCRRLGCLHRHLCVVQDLLFRVAHLL